MWDGNIGIWDFVEHMEAQKSSINCPKDTLVLKKISVTKKAYKFYVDEQVLPTIIEKCPRAYNGFGNYVGHQPECGYAVGQCSGSF